MRGRINPIGRRLAARMRIPTLGSASSDWFSAPKYNLGSVKPVMVADFANNRYMVNGKSAPLTSIFVYSRSSEASYVDSDGLIKWAGVNEGRFQDNSLENANMRGYRPEDGRTNILPYSEDFTGYADLNSTLEPAMLIAPDGMLTGTLLGETTGTTFKGRQFSASVTAGSTLTLSCFFKKTTDRDDVVLSVHSAGFSNFARMFYRFSTGVVQTGASLYTVDRTRVTQYPNGWVRLELTVTTSTDTGVRLYVGLASGSSISYAGVAGYKVGIWGAQYELGANFASSYIRTTGTAASRARDLLVASSSSPIPFASWFNQTEGCLYAEGQNSRAFGPLTGADQCSISTGAVGGSGDNSMLGKWGYSNQHYLRVNGNWQIQAELRSNVGNADNALFKEAGGLKANDFNYSINGIDAMTATSGLLNAVSALFVGTSATVGSSWWGLIKEVRVYPSKPTDAELKALTTL